MYDAAHNTASRATRWTKVDRKNGTCNARRKGRALRHAPAVRGDASWYPRAPRGSRLRGAETEVAFPKPRLRTESTSNRPSNRLAELSRLAGCLRLHSTSKCAKWLMLRAEKRFLSRAPLQAPEGHAREGQKRALGPPFGEVAGPLGENIF